MNLRAILSSIVAFLLVLLVFVYGFGSILIGIGLALLSAVMVAVIEHLVDSYLKPKVSFVVSDYELVPREFGNIRGFQVKLRFMNKGKRIAQNVAVSAHLSRKGEAAKFLRIAVKDESGTKSFTHEIVDTTTFPCKWDADSSRPTLKPGEELRKGDEAKITFPEESRPSSFVGTVSPGSNSFLRFEYENLVEFKPGKYVVSVELKCEDPTEKTTVTKLWRKEIDLSKTDAYSKYWSGVKQ